MRRAGRRVLGCAGWDDVVAGIDSPKVFLKMDTQGFDLQVFRGLGEKAGHVVAIQSELSVLSLYEGAPRWTEAVRFYEDEGFAVAGLYPVTEGQGGEGVIEFDCLMVRRATTPAGLPGR